MNNSINLATASLLTSTENPIAAGEKPVNTLSYRQRKDLKNFIDNLTSWEGETPIERYFLVPLINKGVSGVAAWHDPKNRLSYDKIQGRIDTDKANGVGLVLGEQPDGTYVIAVDFDDENAFKIAEATFGQIDVAFPPTATCKSGRPNREQRFYRVAGTFSKNIFVLKEGEGVPKVDGHQLELRLSKCQSVLPFSAHTEPELIYSGFETLDNIAMLPESTVEKLNYILSLEIEEPKQTVDKWDCLSKEVTEKNGINEEYLLEALRLECERVAGSLQGSRNETLNNAALSLGTLIPHGLDEEEVRCGLLNASQQASISANEANKTINSGIKAGKRKPRKLKEKSGEDEVLEGSKLARVIANIWRETVCYSSATRSFYRYSEGIWNRLDDDDFKADIQTLLDDGLRPEYDSQLISDQFKILKGQLRKRVPKMPRYLIPMANGVLNAQTRELSAHSPANWFTNKIPYDYSSNATSPKTVEKLLEILHQDEGLLLIIQSYFKAILFGWTDIHKFLELIGAPRTGKSTIIKLAQALVGKEWCISKKLKHLENSRFETASIKGKKLLLIPDSDRYEGDVSTLKSITGQDPLPFEEKMKQPGDAFIAECLVILASNHPLKSPDSAALEARRITITFSNPIPVDKRVELLEIKDDGTYEGLLADEIAGIFNWVLDLPDDRARQTLKTPNEFWSQAKAQMKNLVDTNLVAAWAYYNLVVAPGYVEYTGIHPDNDPTADNEQIQDEAGNWHRRKGIRTAGNLYPNYYLWCKAHDIKKPYTVVSFVPELESLLCHILKLGFVARHKDKYGRGFRGVATRAPNHPEEKRPNPLSYGLLRKHIAFPPINEAPLGKNVTPLNKDDKAASKRFTRTEETHPD